GKLLGFHSRVRRTLVQVECEHMRDFGEHFPIATAYRVASPLEDVKRCVDAIDDAAESRLRIEQAASYQCSPEGLYRMQQHRLRTQNRISLGEHVFASNRV